MAGSSRLAPLLAALAHLALAGPAAAQSLTVGDALEDYLRLLQIGGADVPGSFTVRGVWEDGTWEEVGGGAGTPWEDRLAGERARAERGAALSILDPRLGLFANTRQPTPGNDGALWQGKGLTGVLEMGAAARWGPLTLTLRPALLFNQNADVDLAPVIVSGQTEWAYPWRWIDMPQQFGPDAFWTVDPGQSELRLDLFGASAGVSTANLWWGPGIRNAIVMSNNAPGFLHAFLGTDGPLDIGIGGLEARWVWGRLELSDWYAPAATNRDRFITGIVLAYSPEFVPGLSLGLTRVFYVFSDDGVALGDWFAVFQGVRKRTLVTPENPTGDDEHDQLLSLFGRWALRESGFEVYWEWARNDHSWDVRDFVLEPEHSQGYTLGIQKAFELRGSRLLALRFELTHLEADPTFQVRARGTFFTHHIVRPGYTQRGQVIGAAVGPGGNGQHLGADLYAPWGRARLWVQRDVTDNDAYYEWVAANGPAEGWCCHDVSFRFGLDGLWFAREALDLGGGAVVTRQLNRWFEGPDVWNLNLSLTARWRLD
ncbi:MAG TPA: capsule assembly Wzi family protein [Longimicrobiales bacterium]|nr:capsule assembly Wzi family protein [Longimicrobiales bacterium]